MNLGTCDFCSSNKWNATDGKSNPVFWKDTGGQAIHIKCYMYISEHPKEKKVKIWHYHRYLYSLDWVKTKITPEELRDEMGLTENDVWSLDKLSNEISKLINNISLCEFLNFDVDSFKKKLTEINIIRKDINT